MKSWVFFVSFATLLVVSCNKQSSTVETLPQEGAQKTVQVKFKIDGNEVSQKDYFQKLLPDMPLETRNEDEQMLAIAEKYRIVAETGRLEKDGQRYTVVNAFQNDEALLVYLRANIMALKK
jgi:AMMECR1 domain-containing protein